MFVIIEIVVVIGAIVGGYLMEHGNLRVLLQPAELLIIGGAAMGTVLIANPLHILKKIVAGVTRVFSGSKYGKPKYMESMKMLFELFSRARKEGLMALETDSDNPEQSPVFSKYPAFLKDHHVLSFVCDTIRMASAGGIEPFDVDQMMELDMEVHHHDEGLPVSALSTMADSMNSSKQIQQAVGGYFKDPTGTSKMVGSDMRGAGDNFLVSKDDMKELKDQLQKTIREIPNFDKLKNHIDMTVTSEGLRIELTESATGTFFDSGSAMLSGDGSELVKVLAQESGKLPNRIAIEGHSDSQPYPPGATYTNWELSADRANAARRLMQNNGIRADQITQIRGFADQRLRKPEAPQDPSNRRISFIVEYMQKPPEAETSSGAAETRETSKLGEAQKTLQAAANGAKTN